MMKMRTIDIYFVIYFDIFCVRRASTSSVNKKQMKNYEINTISNKFLKIS